MFNVYTAIKIDLHWHMCPYSATNVKPLQAIALVRDVTKVWRHVLLSFQASVHQATFEVSKVHTPAYIYVVKKIKMSNFLVTYIRKNSFELSKVHTRPYTNVRTPSHFEVSKVQTPTYFYTVKNLKCPFFGYLNKKNSFELSNIRIRVHPYTKSCSE